MKQRCTWCSMDPQYLAYHDLEWGVPQKEDRRLFEMLVLEGAQAGLSWLTILKKRDNYRRAFDNFEALQIARYGPDDVERLLQDSGIVRNRMKVDAAIRNARGVLAICESHSSFSDYLWRYVGHEPVQNHWRRAGDIPAQTRTSEQMSRDLKSYGFGFVGPTICYAFMQAVGMVNDHTVDCFRHTQIVNLGKNTGAKL